MIARASFLLVGAVLLACSSETGSGSSTTGGGTSGGGGTIGGAGGAGAAQGGTAGVASGGAGGLGGGSGGAPIGGRGGSGGAGGLGGAGGQPITGGGGSSPGTGGGGGSGGDGGDGGDGGGGLWSKRIDPSEAAAATNGQDIGLTGTLPGAVDFGGGVVLTPAAGLLYTARLSAEDGSVAWANQHVVQPHPGTFISNATTLAITISPTNEIAIGGTFLGQLTIGTTTLMTPNCSPFCAPEPRFGFVAKINSGGSAAWATQFNWSGNGDVDPHNEVRSLAFDPSGGVFAGGFTHWSLNVVGPMGTLMAFTSATGMMSGGPVFISYSTTMNAIARRPSGGIVAIGQNLHCNGSPPPFGPTLYTGCSAPFPSSLPFELGMNAAPEPVFVAVDAQDNMFIVGGFTGTKTFGGQTFTSAGSTDVLIVKLDAGHNVLWAHAFGGTGHDEARQVFIAPSGAPYVIGSFSGNVSFGTTPLTSAGAHDVFVLELDATGGVMDASRYGGAGDDRGQMVGVSPTGAVTIALLSDGPVDLGSGVLPPISGVDQVLGRIE